jgi:hypothetical protein
MHVGTIAHHVSGLSGMPSIVGGVRRWWRSAVAGTTNPQFGAICSILYHATLTRELVRRSFISWNHGLNNILCKWVIYGQPLSGQGEHHSVGAGASLQG